MLNNGTDEKGRLKMEPLLKVEHVTICYNGKPVVQDVSFNLNQGEILGVVGESGSGKSTIVKAIMGLLGGEGMVTRGDIFYKGQNVVDMSEKEQRKLLGPEIGMVFQDCEAALCPIPDEKNRSGGLRESFEQLSF